MSDGRYLRRQVSVGKLATEMAECFNRRALDKHREQRNQENANDRVEVPEPPDVAAMRAAPPAAVA